MRRSFLLIALLAGCASSNDASAPAVEAARAADAAPVADAAPAAEAAPAADAAGPDHGAEGHEHGVAADAAPAATADGWAHYGAPFTVTEQPVAAAQLFAASESYMGKPLLVEGDVVDVCQKAGCWMVLSDGDKSIRVTMKEHGFSVDKQGTGARARIEGTLIAEEMPADTVAHIEGESARPEAMPEKQGVKLQLVATGVSLKKAPAEG